MPLHMIDDPDSGEDFSDTGGGGNSGGGGGGGFNLGGLLNFLPLILGMFGGNRNNNNSNGGNGGGCGGKSLLLLIVVAAAAYFLFFRGGCNMFSSSDQTNGPTNDRFSQSGYHFDSLQTKKATVYEGLEDDNTKNPLPEAVSLLAFAPDRKNQGTQGSCVAWSSAYAARTILEAASTRQDPNSIAYSPSFLYNNIALDNCEGSYIQKAMEFMSQSGAVPLRDFQYDENSCERHGADLAQEAAENKIHGFHRLTESDDVNGINIRAIKEHLAKDAPVVVGMLVGGTFMQDMLGQKVWHPTQDDQQMNGFGGHALCVIGYDDRVEGGAFQIMNSWGPEWGQNGVAFVRYGDFKNFVREAYGLDPLPKKGAALNIAFECNIGLLNPDTKQYVSLHSTGGNIFQTVSPIKKGSKFKIEIKNAVECYIYIFTPDSSGKSFTLFPYKPIHSPYCGITGYRLFPRKESIQADEIGNLDYMGVVVSKTAIDYKALNDAINRSGKPDFAGKLNDAVAADLIPNVNFSSGANGSVYFKTSGDKNLVACIVEIGKQ